MRGLREQIRDVLGKASLLTADYALWEETLPHVPEGVLADLHDALHYKPESVAVLTSILRKKSIAAKNADVPLWLEALREEGEYYERLLKIA
jgi:hypothetical protein